MRTLLALLLLLAPTVAAAAERYVLIVSGASGGEKYAVLQHTWSEELQRVLAGRFGVPSSHIVVLAEEGEANARATAEGVRAALSDLRARVAAADSLLIILLGHGNVDGNDAKFNLVGPDLTAADWNTLLDPMPGRIALVNTTESSFPFVEELSRKGRVVITATDSVSQRFATVFPEYFVQALIRDSSDADKDGQLSLFEAFDAASSAVRLHYEQRGQLSTERPLLDDDGDRVGRESQAPGSDGALARTMFFGPDRVANAPDPATASLERERDRLQREVEELKTRKPLMSDEAYTAELEKLLIALAQVAARIRAMP